MQDSISSTYEQTLQEIKKNIVHLTSNKNLPQYQLWIQRLTSEDNETKAIRNQYLKELSVQIQKNELRFPFTEPPPKKQLNPLLYNEEELNSNNLTAQEQDASSWSDLSSNEMTTSPHQNLNTIQEMEACENLIKSTIKKTILDQKSIEDLYLQQEQEYQQKINSLSSSYEEKVKILQTALNNNSTEISKLNAIIQNECSQINSEIHEIKLKIDNVALISPNNDHTNILEKCVSKMDKLYQKSEMQRIKLNNEISSSEKLSQIKLNTKLSVINAETWKEKMVDFEEILNNLESKYKTILMDKDKEFEDAKQYYERELEKLKVLLVKNNIVVRGQPKNHK